MQDGGKKLTTEKPVVTVGGDVVVSGPPGEVVLVKPDGSAGGTKSVTLDKDGKATFPAPSQPGSITIVLVSDLNKQVSVKVVDLRP